MTRALLCCLPLLMCPTAVAATPAEIIILAGASSKEEGEKAFDKAKADMRDWADDVTPAAGFPKLIESGTVSGLKPGFFVTVWGVCTKANDPALPLLDIARTTVKGPYARTVQWPNAALPCPTSRGVITMSTKTKHGEIVVATTASNGIRGWAALITKDGTLKAREKISEGAMSCDGHDDAVAGGGVEVWAHCVMQSCTQPEEGDINVKVKAKSATELTVKTKYTETVKCVND